MALSQRLELKQGQSLVMTPQLQQAIKLLQLSNLELAEYVEGELERNPLLERDEAEPEPEPIATRPKQVRPSPMRRLPKRSRARISAPPPISMPAHDDLVHG